MSSVTSSIHGHQSDVDIIRRYTGQPEKLPDSIRRTLEQQWGGPVQLYAFVDLDGTMAFTQRWLVLGAHHMAEVCANGDVRSFSRQSITAIQERPGLSSDMLIVHGQAGEPPLAMIHYTYRQKRAVENIKFLLEQQLQGRVIEVDDADRTYGAAMAQAVRSAQASVSSHHLAVLWRLLTYLGPYRKNLVIGMLSAAVMTMLNLIPPYLIKHLIDDVYQPYSAGLLARSPALHGGLVLVGILAGIYLLRELGHWVRLRLMSVLGENVARDLRAQLYEHLQRLSIAYYSRKKTGSIISRVSSDSDRLWDFIAFGVVEVSLALITLVGLSGVLIALDWRLGLMITVPVPLLLWALATHSRSMTRLFLRAWRKWSGLTEVLSDTIPGMRVVKAFAQENREKFRFNRINDNCLNEFNQVHVLWTKFWPRLLLGMHAIVVMVWMFALPRLLDQPGYTALSFGTFMAVLMYMGMFLQPIETIGMMTRMMNRATSSAVRIFEVLDTQPDFTDVAEPVRLKPVRGDVRFERVNFSYDPIRPVLHDVSFEVKAGEMIGLVGPSGAGKTTITQLLARFYEPTGGRIEVDGVDLNRLETGHYRRQIGMVLQEPHLFHGTLLDNIRYGIPRAGLDEVVAAAKAANVHDFVCRLPLGYDTVVGERGHTLSGGERQRVSIARAILINPRILILDEATSSVDTETEHKIQEALDQLIRGRTVFAIAHRLSTLRKADRLFVFDGGRLVEQGRHEELLAMDGGTYRRLFELQNALHQAYAL